MNLNEKLKSLTLDHKQTLEQRDEIQSQLNQSVTKAVEIQGQIKLVTQMIAEEITNTEEKKQ